MSSDIDRFMTSMKDMGDKFDDGLTRVHERMDEIGSESSKSNEKLAVFAERLTNHIDRLEIHTPPEACKRAFQVQKKVDDHIDHHPEIVKSDIGNIIGMAFIGAVLLVGGTYVATLIFN